MWLCLSPHTVLATSTPERKGRVCHSWAWLPIPLHWGRALKLSGSWSSTEKRQVAPFCISLQGRVGDTYLQCCPWQTLVPWTETDLVLHCLTSPRPQSLATASLPPGKGVNNHPLGKSTSLPLFSTYRHMGGAEE